MSPEKLLALVVGRFPHEETNVARDATSVLSVAPIGTTASEPRGSSTAAERTEPIAQLSWIAEVFDACGEKVTPKQVEHIWWFTRTFYFRSAGYHGVPDAKAWEGLGRERRRAYLCAAGELLRDFPTTRCLKCGGPCDDDGDLYCSRSCAIDAENNR